MTHNPYGLKIELNMSRGQHYIDLIMDFGVNRDNLIGSHNFYPQRFTGWDVTTLQKRQCNTVATGCAQRRL